MATADDAVRAAISRIIRARDLVTPHSPRGRCHLRNLFNDRLFQSTSILVWVPLRSEVAEYVRWVAGFFAKDVVYNQAVTSIQADPVSSLYCGDPINREQVFARSLVVAQADA